MEWIASRTLTDDSGNELTVSLGAPFAIGPLEWACPYNVSGLSPAEIMQAHGHDAIQALLMAFVAIHSVLSESPKPLTWAGGKPGDTGIPRLPTMGFGLSLRRHVENIMNVEEQSWIAALASRGTKPKDPT